ncbi:MAG: SusD/RagB family nutrient-binding outer membrane lipoprotein [Bacteroidales bacterium]
MKRIKYSLVALVASALLLSSCSNSFFDINNDPNNPAESTPALVLPSAVAGSAYVMGGYYHALGSFWSQQYAQAPAASQWAEWESYNLTEDDFDRQFRILYTGALYDYEYVRKSAAASENWSYYAISTLMQAYTYQVLADLYDQIPFTEALKGDQNFQPHYDDGDVVYDSLLVRIDDAISKDFSAKTSEDPGSYDLIFGGDMEYWKKFANTLKLKIYLRYVNVDVNKYKSQITALLAENNFLDEDAAFSAFTDASQNNYNPFFNTFIDRLTGNVVANKTLVNYLTDNNDPRLELFFDPSATGSLYTGVAAGESADLSGTSKNYATPAITEDYPVYFFTVEETYFLIAEAQARYGTEVAAKNAYETGLKLSFTGLGLSATNSSIYPYNGIQSIIEQKWVAAINKRAIEAFFDFNRTGYPDFFTKSLTSVWAGDDSPQRLFFPDSERQSNSNTPDKVALNVKVWWGK